jgi:hypothetical protein
MFQRRVPLLVHEQYFYLIMLQIILMPGSRMMKNENEEPSACTLLILLQPAGLLRVTSDQNCAALCCGIEWEPCSCQQLHHALPTLLYHQSRSQREPRFCRCSASSLSNVQKAVCCCILA